MPFSGCCCCGLLDKAIDISGTPKEVEIQTSSGACTGGTTAARHLQYFSKSSSGHICTYTWQRIANAAGGGYGSGFSELTFTLTFNEATREAGASFVYGNNPGFGSPVFVFEMLAGTYPMVTPTGTANCPAHPFNVANFAAHAVITMGCPIGCGSVGDTMTVQLLP